MTSPLHRLRREWRILSLRMAALAGGIRLGSRGIAYGALPYLKADGAAVTIGSRAVFYGREARVSVTGERAAVLVIGSGALLNSGSSVHSRQSVVIGRNLLLAPFASISDTDFHQVHLDEPVRTRPVVIGDNVWIGRSAVILPGVTIGDGAVIGAGSIVSKDVEPFTVAAGIPAATIRRLNPFRERRR